jgi:hypothetical protein
LNMFQVAKKIEELLYIKSKLPESVKSLKAVEAIDNKIEEYEHLLIFLVESNVPNSPSVFFK